MARTTLDKVNGAHSLGFMLREAGLTQKEYDTLAGAMADAQWQHEQAGRAPGMGEIRELISAEAASIRGEAMDAAITLWRYGPVTGAEVANRKREIEALEAWPGGSDAEASA